MALSDFQRMVAYDAATLLWQQDLLMKAYFHGSSIGENLRAMLVGRKAVRPLTNPFDEAITGRLRSDSATIRQNARNVREAGFMMGMAAGAVGTIKSALEEMKVLAQKVFDGDLAYSSALRNQYNALRERITSIIENTCYNGISLLDSGRWGNDQIDSDGNVQIQAFLNGGFNVTFRALDQVDWGKLDGAGLEDNPSGSLQAQLQLLSDYLRDSTTLEGIYIRRQDGLEFQAATLESQADLLDQAIAARRQVPRLSLEEILLQLLSRKSGSIVDQLG